MKTRENIADGLIVLFWLALAIYIFWPAPRAPVVDPLRTFTTETRP